jgi:hypothetical protein
VGRVSVGRAGECGWVERVWGERLWGGYVCQAQMRRAQEAATRKIASDKAEKILAELTGLQQRLGEFCMNKLIRDVDGADTEVSGKPPAKYVGCACILQGRAGHTWMYQEAVALAKAHQEVWNSLGGRDWEACACRPEPSSSSFESKGSE